MGRVGRLSGQGREAVWQGSRRLSGQGSRSREEVSGQGSRSRRRCLGRVG